MSHLLLNLMDHMRWADDLTARAISRADAPDAESTRLFAHVAAAEHLWYSRIIGHPALHAVWPQLSVDESRTLATVNADLFDRLVRAGDADLARVVPYRNSAGQNFTNSIADILAHVAMHGSHHRGQIGRRLRSVGQEPPYVDYIQFVRRAQEG